MEYKEGIFTMGRCNIIVSIDDGLWHLSISTPSASPSYNEIKKARYKFLPPDITVAQIFPPEEEFVNLHPFCHHLWQIEKKQNFDKEKIQIKLIDALSYIMPPEDIAKKLDLSRTKVYKLIKDNNIVTYQLRVIERAVTMLKTKSVEQVSKELNVDVKTLYNWKEKYR